MIGKPIICYIPPIAATPTLCSICKGIYVQYVHDVSTV
jgi:hypothetical protein